MISRNDPCWCGSNKKWKKCHYPKKNNSSFLKTKDSYFKKYGIIIKNEKEIEGIKKACALASKILDILCLHAKEGVTTLELDNLSMQLHKENNATPAPIGYGTPPYPKSICTSLNEVICHGIPDNTALKEGDILNIDVTTILDGYYGDTSRMVTIGKISKEKQLLIDVAYECLKKSIQACRPNMPLNKIAEVIEDIARKNNCSVVYQFVGHGVGLDFHEPPQIPFHYNPITTPLTEGMVFTIEPMINLGVAEGIIDAKDKWTARTKDSKPSAQWEHTILITNNGYEVLTLAPNEKI